MGGSQIGRLDDVVVTAAHYTAPPRVTGFVAAVQRRLIFVNAGRVAELDGTGARLRSGAIHLDPFRQRPGELLATRDLLDRQVGHEIVYDVGITVRIGRISSWEVASIALGPPRFLKRKAGRVVDWREGAAVFAPDGTVPQELDELRDLHAADAAAALGALPMARQFEVVAAIEDERLADILEEMPEDQQVEILEHLDIERAADVLEEMAPDDAADVLAEMGGEDRSRILSAMLPEEAEPVRRLLGYGAETAGGLMTPEPIIVAPSVTVAEALARLRDPAMPVAHATQVFVAEPPTSTPTGRYLGVVGFQRLLREAPSVEVGRCIDDSPDPLTPDVIEAVVAERLATYNLMAVPVCDEAGRLVGAVTVDDVLDHLLPEDWRD